jgi:hypothetical protein
VASGTDYESTLGIVNGASAVGYPWPDGGFSASGQGLNDNFKENLLIRIDDGTTPQYFTVDYIKGNGSSTTFFLKGEPQSWPTSGSNVQFSIYKANKKPFVVPDQINPASAGHSFTSPIGGGPPQDGVSRTGSDIIDFNVDYSTPMAFRASLLNSANKSQVAETIVQQENISFTIEYADGSQEEGSL